MSQSKGYTWIIGDVHGMYDHLNTLLSQIDNEETKKFIFLGDLIDRGPSSLEVVKKVMSLKKETIYLMGNHEHMMLDELNSGKKTVSLPKFLWEFNGGNKTINSFGCHDIKDFTEKYSEEYSEFFDKMKIVHTEKITYKEKEIGFIFAHAGIYPFTPLATQLSFKNYDDFNDFYIKEENDHSNSPVWVRNSFFDANPEFWKGNIIVHGHTPTQKMQYFCTLPPEEKEDLFSKINPDFYISSLPFFRKHQETKRIASINLDTGVAYGGRLTAMGISEENIIENEDGTFLTLEIIQIDASSGFSSDKSLRFFEYNIEL